MTIKELKELLDNYGDHVEIRVGRNIDQAHKIDVVEYIGSNASAADPEYADPAEYALILY